MMRWFAAALLFAATAGQAAPTLNPIFSDHGVLQRGGPISVWARDRYKGERVSRRLPSETTWFGRHGISPTAPEVRIARYVVPRQLEWRAPWAPGTPRLPVRDTSFMTAVAEARHGRESRRWPALRALIRSARNR